MNLSSDATVERETKIAGTDARLEDRERERPSLLSEREGGATPWLFSRSTDLWAFGAPTLASLALVVIGFVAGVADDELPAGLWLIAVLAVDVAHVWSTTFRVYTDPAELRRRPLLYFGAPLLVYALGVALHLSGGPLRFWRVLAYAAVFHFIKQQVGWVRLYRRRSNDRGRVNALVDEAAIYAATIYPLIYWHANLPRHFHWFLEGDFISGVPHVLERIGLVLYVLSLSAYVLKAVLDARAKKPIVWGKHLVVVSTVLCWYLGIVAFDSDYLFSVTNVLIHGVPYFVLVWHYGRGRYSRSSSAWAWVFRDGWALFYFGLVCVAFFEEGAWDNFVWHDHANFFGNFGFDLGQLALALVVPLLAVPQATHYVLDGFVWRGGAHNPQLAERLGWSRSAQPVPR